MTLCVGAACVHGKQDVTQNMTEQDSTIEDQMTTLTSPVEVTASTAGSDITSSSSLRAGFYFKCAVIFIGVVGTAANALILYAMVVSKQHKKCVLVFNQNALDLYSCFTLVITYIVKLCNIHLSGTLGYYLCVIVLSECLLWAGLTGSVVNLAAVTVERYLKVVHATWSRNKLRKWMMYSAAAFSWIGGFAYGLAIDFATTIVIDGVCYAMAVWKSPVAKLAHVIWNFASFYVGNLLLFIFCYCRILVVVRRQARVMAGHAAAGPSTSQTQSNPIQTNIIKTMIFVSAFFAISWMPMKFQFFLATFNNNVTYSEDAYYSVLFIAFLYICANPFIYAIKFDPVKSVLLGLIPCKKNTVEPVASVPVATPGVAAIRAVQTRN